LPDGYFDLMAEFKEKPFLSIKLTGVWTKPLNVTIVKGQTGVVLQCEF